MINYILRRILGMIPLLLGITIISFLLIKLAPGKPIILQQSLNPKISLEEIRRLEKLEGLDKPIIVQYKNWLFNLLSLNFGRSLSDGRLVSEKIRERLAVTVGINLLSLLLVVILAIPLGVKAALGENSFFDHCLTVITYVLFAVPTFWLALLLMQLFCIQLNWLPISGLASLDFEYLGLPEKAWDIFRHLFLPVLILSLGSLAGMVRYMRQSMISAIKQPYIYTALAKGLGKKRVYYLHALRNAVLPIITILGLSLPGLLGGSIIFESIFAIPGIGRLFYEAAMMRDYNLIMAEIVFVAVLTMLGNLLADISYAYADPRIRYGKED